MEAVSSTWYGLRDDGQFVAALLWPLPLRLPNGGDEVVVVVVLLLPPLLLLLLLFDQRCAACRRAALRRALRKRSPLSGRDVESCAGWSRRKCKSSAGGDQINRHR